MEPINAYIIDQRGRKVVDFKNNNLHLLNYSQSYQGFLNLQNLKTFIF